MDLLPKLGSKANPTPLMGWRPGERQLRMTTPFLVKRRRRMFSVGQTIVQRRRRRDPA
jgi:hypothetical protein